MALHWSGRCGAPTALRCSFWRPASRNSLRSRRSLRSNSRDESVDASRCALDRPPCASRRPRGAPPSGPARLGNWARWMLGMIQKIASRQALPDGGACRGGEKRSTALDALSAFRHHDGRGCPNGVSVANRVSSAARALCEHRSGVGATRRPPRVAPQAGSAWREAGRLRAAYEPPRVGTLQIRARADEGSIESRQNCFHSCVQCRLFRGALQFTSGE